MDQVERRVRVRELRAKGSSSHEIAAVVGVSSATVHKDLVALGLAGREPSPEPSVEAEPVVGAAAPEPAGGRGYEGVLERRLGKPKVHVPRPGRRVARVCTHKDCVPPRRFFGDPDWTCPEHGSSHTVSQSNRPYRGLPSV